MERFLLWSCLILFLSLPPSVFAADIVFDKSFDNESFQKESEIVIPLSLSISAADDTQYYLRGVFYKEGTNRYCGYTWNGNDFFNGPYSTNEGYKKFLSIVIHENSWKGDLKVKIDPSDSSCSDSGAYNFRVQRFTESGSSNFDNQSELSFNFVIPTVTPTPTNTPKPTKEPTSTKVPKPTKIEILENIKKETVSQEKDGYLSPTRRKSVMTITAQQNFPRKDKDIAGISDAPFRETEGESHENAAPSYVTSIVTGFGMLALACGILLYKKIKSRYEEDNI